jgi:hypothetical protein
MHLLSAALHAATGRTEEAYAREHLFGPLGITDLTWLTDPQGVTRGWGDLYLHPRDAAKLGQLWIAHGSWGGVPIVSPEWIETSVTLQARTGGGDDYGYGWWLPTETESGEHKAVGRGGQHIAVHPAFDLVVVLTGNGYDPEEVIGLLAPAFVAPGGALPAAPAADEALAEAVALVREPPPAEPVADLPSTALLVAGVTWDIDENPRSIETVRLDFHPGAHEASIEITFSNAQPARTGAVGLDGILRIGPGRDGLKDGFRGRWTDERTFVVEYDEIAHGEAFMLWFRFEGDRMTLDGRERSHTIGFSATGTRRSPEGSPTGRSARSGGG